MYHIKNDQPAIRVSQMLVDALVVLMGQKKFVGASEVRTKWAESSPVLQAG